MRVIFALLILSSSSFLFAQDVQLDVAQSLTANVVGDGDAVKSGQPVAVDTWGVVLSTVGFLAIPASVYGIGVATSGDWRSSLAVSSQILFYELFVLAGVVLEKELEALDK